MAKEMETPKDEGLQGNETIEEAILGLQKEPTPELLAHVLTVIRRRMKEGGQAILSVEPPSGDAQIRIGTVKSADGKVWWAAFTSFDEELKGSSSVKSTFLVSLEQLIHMASETKEISGVIFNPWNRTIMLDHTLLSIKIGEEKAGQRIAERKKASTERLRGYIIILRRFYIMEGYQVTDIGEKIYCILDAGNSSFYVVEGEEKAAGIDTGITAGTKILPVIR